MESRAIAKWIRTSPRKMRRVVNEIRGKSAGEALDMLEFMPFRAAREVRKVVHSAMFNLIHHEKHPISKDEARRLKVVESFVDQGPSAGRWRARARGRVAPIVKRSSHVTVVLSDV